MKKLALAIMLSIGFAVTAFAQAAVPTVTTTTTAIDYGQAFGWLQPYVISFVGTLLTAAATWIVFLVNKWLGIKIDKDQADVYLRAAKNQASSLIADGFVKIRENGKVEVNNPALAAAANDLLKSVPDAAGHFNVQIDDAMKKIVDMVPTVNGVPVEGQFVKQPKP